MNPVERTKILQNIRALSTEGQVTFVIVEHDMDVVFSLSERVIVLHRGEIIGDGTPEQVKANPEVREVYLGEEVA
jgi:branched-chain amino acid transport system ATP-binding protein